MRYMANDVTVSAKIDTDWEIALRALAIRWSEEMGEQVTRSDVMRALLADGLERNPVNDEERARAQRGEKPRPKKAEPKPRMVLRLATSEDGRTSPRGGDAQPWPGEQGEETRVAA